MPSTGALLSELAYSVTFYKRDVCVKRMNKAKQTEKKDQTAWEKIRQLLCMLKAK